MEFARPTVSLLAGVVAALASGLFHFLAAGRLGVLPPLLTGLAVGGAIGLIEEFERGRPGRLWRAALQRASQAVGVPPHEHPVQPTQLRHLVRVVPIARTQVLGDGIELVLLSLEVYADGFVLRGCLFRDAAPLPGQAGMPPHPDMLLLPDLDFRVSDDRGGHYAVSRGSSSGDGSAWHFEYRGWPMPEPAAHVLRVELAAVRWRRWVDGQAQEAKAQPGPWTFMVPLRGEEHAEP